MTTRPGGSGVWGLEMHFSAQPPSQASLDTSPFPGRGQRGPGQLCSAGEGPSAASPAPPPCRLGPDARSSPRAPAGPWTLRALLHGKGLPGGAASRALSGEGCIGGGVDAGIRDPAVGVLPPLLQDFLFAARGDTHVNSATTRAGCAPSAWLRTFPAPHRVPPGPISSHLLHPHPHPHESSLSLNLPALDIFYQEDRITRGLPCPVAFSQSDVPRLVQPWRGARAHRSVLWLRAFPWHGWAPGFCRFIH